MTKSPKQQEKTSRGHDESLDRMKNANTVTLCGVFPQDDGHTVKRWKYEKKNASVVKKKNASVSDNVENKSPFKL